VQLGYLEADLAAGMPVRQTLHPVPLDVIGRPDLGLHGINDNTVEKTVPADIAELWNRFTSLTQSAREQFVRVAKTWQLAQASGIEHETASVALMVVACEALKPAAVTAAKKKERVYFGDVISALLGSRAAEQIEAHRPHPQGLRDKHLHNAELAGDELDLSTMLSTYSDPSFDQMRQDLAIVTPAAIIEWLRCAGEYSLPNRPRPK
jgi:hypothetical protein